MEDVAQKIEDLIEVLNNNSVPLWLTVFCMIVPIIISVTVAVFAVFQHYQNKGLQKAISDKELRVQMHGDIMSIYDNHCMAQTTVGRVGDNIAVIFANPNIMYQWANELLNAVNAVCQANNRAELLLPKSDEDLRAVLKNIFDKLKSFCQLINDYINSGIAESIRQQTWSKIYATYGVPINDYNLLSCNGKATEDFIKLCSNETTKKLDNEVNDVLDLYDYDKFDKYFEPYLRMYTE